MNIGERIKQRRIELGMSQEELAKKMGYTTRNAIYQFEKKDNMKLSIISEFAKALDTTEAYLTGWEEEEKSSAAQGVRAGRLISYIGNKLDDTDVICLTKLMELSQDQKEAIFNQIDYYYNKK